MGLNELNTLEVLGLLFIAWMGVTVVGLAGIMFFLWRGERRVSGRGNLLASDSPVRRSQEEA